MDPNKFSDALNYPSSRIYRLHESRKSGGFPAQHTERTEAANQALHKGKRAIIRMFVIRSPIGSHFLLTPADCDDLCIPALLGRRS